MADTMRQRKLAKILRLLQESGYLYDKSRGEVRVTGRMPPPGTRMNCESAARIFMQLAFHLGLRHLQAVFFRGGEHGCLAAAEGVLALGCPPELSTPAASGWEFDNHWRVTDLTTGVVYDPTFGTWGERNPAGIRGTSVLHDQYFNLTTIYGEKYRVSRKGAALECTQVSDAPLEARYRVTDCNFTPKLPRDPQESYG